MPEARRTYISLDAVFDEDFTSPISMPDLPFQGAIRLRDIKVHTNLNNSEVITEETGPIYGENESFPNIAGLSYPTSKDLIDKDNSLLNHKRGRYITRNSQEEDETESMSNEDSMIVHTYFAKMPRMQDDNMGYTEYLHAAHDLQSTKKNEERYQDTVINLSDFIPEPKSLPQILKWINIYKKWGEAIRKEINGLFDNGTYEVTER